MHFYIFITHRIEYETTLNDTLSADDYSVTTAIHDACIAKPVT
jgi:hypothetical protein